LQTNSRHRYLQDADIALRHSKNSGSIQALLALSALNDVSRDTAFVWELCAQAVMYILCCVAMVYTSLSASSRLRKLNLELAKYSIELHSPQVDAVGDKLIQKKDLMDIRISTANSALRARVRSPLNQSLRLLSRFDPDSIGC
jgi:hypothetical protein